MSWLAKLFAPQKKESDVEVTTPITTAPKPSSGAGFDMAFERIIGHEGGYTTVRADRGNWTSGRVGVGELKGTKYGIAAMAYPDLDIKNLTLADAKKIYERDYWLRSGADQYDGAIGFQVFDAAVNHGIGNAIRMLQRAVGVLDDGAVGPITLNAVKSRSATDVISLFNAERLVFYTNISTWPDFGKGWTRRVAGNLRYAAQDT